MAKMFVFQAILKEQLFDCFMVTSSYSLIYFTTLKSRDTSQIER